MHWDYTDITEIYETLKEYYNTDTFSVLCSIQKYKRFHDIIKRPYDACYGVNFIPIIAVDYNVYVCCHHRGNPKCSLGSLKEKTFKELWSNRQTVFDNIDLSKCIPFCRSDEFNRLLYEIKKPKNHINFL